MNLFVSPPKINPAVYLSETDARKTAGVRLTSSPSYWDDEITQTLIRDHPYIPPQRVVVNFKRKDDAQGAAFGYIGIIGAPHVSIPVIVKDRELSPLDVLIVRTNKDTDVEQGAGDLMDDKVIPLTEESFEQALDAGDIGEVAPEMEIRGTGYTEDGSQLRLPFRGRTVLASYMGSTEKAKKKLASLLESSKELCAGFMLNGTEDVVNSWLAAREPVNTVQQKLASASIEPSMAVVLADLPTEKSPAEFLAAEIYTDTHQTKVAATFEAVDLTAPAAKPARYLVFEDGSYSRAPVKVAVANSSHTEEQMAQMIVSKIASRSLHCGSTVSFMVDDNRLTVPTKIAAIAANEAEKTIRVTLTDDLQRAFNVILAPGIKVATFDPKQKQWILPLMTQVVELGEYNSVPIQTEKIASYFTSQLSDKLVCANGQYSLVINGDTFGAPQCSESKISKVLNTWFANGPELLSMVKSAAAINGGVGSIHFQSNLNSQANTLVKLASDYNGFPALARTAVGKVAIPLEDAVKLAAAIGDPNGVDAILSAGFLSEDNLAEFVSLTDQFEDVVSKLARLLLAIRMGMPGDEAATVVAMKALQRVTERLQSAIQEVKG